MDDSKKPLTYSAPLPVKRADRRLPVAVAVVSSLALVVVGGLLVITWLKELPCSSSSSTSPSGLTTSDSFASNDCSAGAKQKATFHREWLKFFYFSDLHVDPEYVTNTSRATYCREENGSEPADFVSFYGRYGCDSPALLLSNAMETVRNYSVTEKPDFMIVTGDNAAHDLGTKNGVEVLKAITISAGILRDTFADMYIFPCLGNNDLPEHYYIPPHPQGWYNELLKQWKDFVICDHCYWRYEERPVDEKEFVRTFMLGGFYKAQLSPEIVLLVLNTGYFSRKATVQTPLFLRTAQRQLRWLSRNLQVAEKRGQRVIIAGHIPPGPDTFSQKPYWFRNYTEAYVNITAKRFPHVIGGQLFGHMHKDDYRFFYADSENPSLEQSTSLLLAGSISPVYDNNPSFRLVYVDDRTGTFVDYIQWYMNMATTIQYNETYWLLDYIFSQAYPSCLGQVINNERILELTEGIISKTNDRWWLEYIWHRPAEYVPAADRFSQNLMYCCMRSKLPEDLEKCKEKHPFIIE